MPTLISTTNQAARWTITARQGRTVRTFAYLTNSEAEEIAQKLLASGWALGVVSSI